MRYDAVSAMSRLRHSLRHNAETLKKLDAPDVGRVGLAMRTTDIALQQGINMRRRVLSGLHKSGQRKVAYWSISDPVDTYGCGNPTNFSSADSQRAASMPTRLTRFEVGLRESVMQTGYAHCDASLRGNGIVSLVTGEKVALPRIG